jgi:hypothetical protein
VKAYFSLVIIILFQAQLSFAQWPKDITAKNGAVISIYQPQPESMEGAKLDGRAAFSVVEKAGAEPIFGVMWYSANMITDRDTRELSLESIKINDVKLPGVDDQQKIQNLKALLEKEIPSWKITASLDDITTTIEQEQAIQSENLKNDPPVIHYKAEPTTLVLIDGEPKLQDDKDLKMKRVVNSAFLIIENPDDKQFYLYGGQFWYVSASVKEGYKPTTSLTKSIKAIDEQIKQKQTEKPQKTEGGPPAILISTTPAELIQSTGTPQFSNIAGTDLLYVSNTEDNIFKAVSDQQYYVLLSGRWYNSPALQGPWKYIAPDKLPTDFAKIPEGSDKDNVLVSVAGTAASKDAVRDAQVPQTAKVDRKTATCTVAYNGEPKFEKIEGTSLELAMNTESTVVKSGSKYFCVDKGVWFVSSAAKGPWKVSDERPADVDKIPASSSAYNVKYVYIYESTPEVVYVGYTPGYMGCYVYGPTVVYGTGYYYTPWYGPYYYPRPVTYGFSMHYNPWTGWSMGFHYSAGFFSFSMYGGGGYWGPPMYRPPFYPPYHGGMYGGRGPVYIHNDNDINIDRSNNIYNKRNDVTTNDVRRGNGNPSASTRDQTRGGAGSQKPTQQPAGQRPSAGQQPAQGNRKNDVYSDKNGNVYQRDNNGDWNQRNGDQWQKTQQSSQMNRDYENRQRSEQRNSGYQQMNQGGNMGGSYRGSGGGGGARPAGGGGGGRRR